MLEVDFSYKAQLLAGRGLLPSLSRPSSNPCLSSCAIPQDKGTKAVLGHGEELRWCSANKSRASLHAGVHVAAKSKKSRLLAQLPFGEVTNHSVPAGRNLTKRSGLRTCKALTSW